MSLTLIIDGDPLIFQACKIAEPTVYDVLPVGENVEGLQYEDYQEKVIQTFRYVRDYKEWLKEHGKEKEDFNRVSRKEVGPFEMVQSILDGKIREMRDTLQPSQIILYISNKAPTFRDELATVAKYKGNREDQEDPHHFWAARDYLQKKWNAHLAPEGIETDDVVACQAYACMKDHEPFALATVDKDLNAVPGLHFNYTDNKLFNVSWENARRNFLAQILEGDRADNIPGLPGVGKKGAEGYVVAFQEMSAEEKWQAVVQLYSEHYPESDGESIATEMAQLVHLQRWRGDVWKPLENL